MAGIYIHVPYCKTRCIYCDFFTQTNTSSKTGYISAVAKEIELRKDYLGKEPIKTIYFGGGTPSQLSEDDFKHIFEAINNSFEVIPNAEITMEANPDDLSESYISMIQSLPFNRLSIGIQSFNDKELNFLKRRHSAQRAKDVVKLCKQAGFDNISIDLMYGLPNQTMDIWMNNLEEAISLDVQHISSYHLIYEQGTKLFKLFKQGEVMPVAEDMSVDMFSVMIDKLNDAGFEHYEISNFAKNNLYAKHNSSYWLGEKYLGLGPAAHSFDGQNRAWNIASISKYIAGIDNKNPDIEIEYLDPTSQYNDFILTGLRTMWGVNLAEVKNRFGDKMLTYCLNNVQRYVDQDFVKNENSILKLTREGIFISDGITSDLMYIK
ncbi:radical SAM family heme chaperone HemW [Dysgonomonas sp. ZJ279]|uniref:radical SAM family heme chaperone HemW n=1 Tax=Dysgonomonas sp. ZJ279 TaxID=2709796 RepID=UPI0013EB21F0|nr:radical SAM family heme chaperone HemW [Dysgonomonas sp. ZJ279]